MSDMRRLNPLVVVIVLAFWIISGPIGMAFDGCAMMGTMCEAPCGISSYSAAPTAAQIGALAPISDVDAASVHHAATIGSGPPFPPPKLLLSA